jgi:hypothetical protein
LFEFAPFSQTSVEPAKLAPESEASPTAAAAVVATARAEAAVLSATTALAASVLAAVTTAADAVARALARRLMVVPSSPLVINVVPAADLSAAVAAALSWARV